jgi:hypothetical protein
MLKWFRRGESASTDFILRITGLTKDQLDGIVV